MTVLGIDPSTTRVGLALYDTRSGKFVWAYGVDVPDIRLPKGMKDSRYRGDHKLSWLDMRIPELLPEGMRVDHVAIEKQFSMGNTADWQLHVLAWLFRVRCREVHLPWTEMGRPEAYSRVLGKGRGRATKNEMQVWMETHHPEIEWGSQDETDAAAHALATARALEEGDRKA